MNSGAAVWSLQEASPEFEVVNIDGKTTDALTVSTFLSVSQIIQIISLVPQEF